MTLSRMVSAEMPRLNLAAAFGRVAQLVLRNFEQEDAVLIQFFQIQSPRLENKSLPTRQLTNATWRRIMKAVIASLLFAATITASPAFARDYSRNAAHQQGDSVYQGNQYLGSDPDPQVQFDLEREAGSRHGGY
jgi:hypothetical protein